MTRTPRHLFEAIRRSRYLAPKYRAVVDSSIQTNGFFALPENILLSMVTDPGPDVRKDALNKILRARKEEIGACGVRYNIVPNINFRAKDYSQMIDWEDPTVSITVPPVLRKFKNRELTEKLSAPEVCSWAFTSYPCHTVAVERTVKLVTSASETVCGWDARDRQIRSTLLSRQHVPIFDTKSQFVSFTQTD